MTFQAHLIAKNATYPEVFSVRELLAYLPEGSTIGDWEEGDDGKRWAPVYGILGELVGTVARE